MSSDAPDMTAANRAAESNAEIGRETLALARQQYSDNKVRMDKYEPIFQQLMDASLKQQKLSQEQGETQWEQYKTIWAPIEKQMAEKSANYDTQERRAAEAEAAAADVGQAYNQQRLALDRDLGRSNTTVSSGKSLALRAGMAMDQAKATASAQGTARRQVEQTGLSLLDNAARFGRNMPSTGIAAAQQGLSAGQSAQSGMSTQQSLINSGLAGVQGLYGTSASATQSAINNATNQAQIAAGVNSSNQATAGAAVGTAAMAAIAI